MAVVGDNGRPLAGWPSDVWHFICRIRFCPDGAAVVISSSDYNGCKWKYGRGFCSCGWVSSCHFLLFWVMELSQLVIRHCLVKNPGGCWFGIFSMTVTYRFRAVSGYWTIIGCLVVPGWRSWWYSAVRSRSGAHSSRRSYARVLFSEVSRMSSLLDLPLPCGWETWYNDLKPTPLGANEQWTPNGAGWIVPPLSVRLEKVGRLELLIQTKYMYDSPTINSSGAILKSTGGSA